MALAISALYASQPLTTVVKDGANAAPILPVPDAGPVQPPLVAAPPVNVVTDPSPYQNRGEGTTPFTVSSGFQKPAIVAIPLPPAYSLPELYPAPNDPTIYSPITPVPSQLPKPLPDGTKVVMPVPKGQQPVRTPTEVTQPQVPVPSLASLNLSTVPWWGWAVAVIVLVKILD